MDRLQCLIVDFDAIIQVSDAFLADKLEASVEAVAVVAERNSETLSENISQLSVVRPPVTSAVKEAANVVSGVNFGQSWLLLHSLFIQTKLV